MASTSSLPSCNQGPVHSPQAAVRAAIVAEYREKPPDDKNFLMNYGLVPGLHRLVPALRPVEQYACPPGAIPFTQLLV